MGRPIPVDVPMVEVELVKQAPAVQGAPAHPAPAPAHRRHAATRALRRSAGAVALDSRRRASRPRRPPVRIGNAERDLDPLWVTGDHVMPPAPDAAYRNRPPAYPPQAARAGEQGVVQPADPGFACGTARRGADR